MQGNHSIPFDEGRSVMNHSSNQATCTDQNIGDWIALYEFDLLTNEERDLFEAHAMKCAACFEELKSFYPVVQTMTDNKRKFRKLFREPLKDTIKVTLTNHFKVLVYKIRNFFIKPDESKLTLFPLTIRILSRLFLPVTAFIKDPSMATLPKLPFPIRLLLRLIVPVMIFSLILIVIPVNNDLSSLATRKSTVFQPVVLRGYNLIDSSLIKGRIAFNKTDYANAIDLLKQSVTGDTASNEAILLYGLSFYMTAVQGPDFRHSTDLDTAITYLQRASKTEGYQTQANWYLANAYIAKNQFKNALPLLSIISESDIVHADEALALKNDIVNNSRTSLFKKIF
jgi:hypothetical protein